MMTLSIYVVSADLTTLNAIFNGVAMICAQTAFIWGVAMLASMWILLSTVIKAPIAALGGNAQGVLPKGSFNAIMPFIMAMLLTNPGFQGQVQVNSTINGNVTVINNVPFVISVIPAVGSMLSQQAGALVETAFQGTGTDYASISATGNGFINPLKVLLSSRSALNRLNGLQSEMQGLATNCLAPSAGIDSSQLYALVNNAGNSGATAAESIPINGANPTALGALLFQASLSPGYDNAMAGNGLVSCLDAATIIANDITNALNSAEFSRVVQGAVNGMDQPNQGGAVDPNTMTQQYLAARNASSINGVASIGANQAAQEVVNLLAGEMVENQLTCLDKSSSDKAICEAAMVQANELERNNLQFAAAEIPMLKYAGSFANYLLALIIGLGPIMVIFMMFAGFGAAKCVKTVAHLIAWPLLVTNVGAELINGMIYIQIAHFAQGLVGAGGLISQAQSYTMYKELSFQVGSASHMMASLPVIMGMIFALGESAALVNVGSNIGSKGDAVADDVNAPLMKQDSLFSAGALSRQTQLTPSGEAIIGATGSLDQNNLAQHSKLAMEAGNRLSSSESAKNSETQTDRVMRQLDHVAATGEASNFSTNDSNMESFGKDLKTFINDTGSIGTGKNSSVTETVGSRTTASAAANVSAKGGGAGGGGVGGSIGGGLTRTGQASDTTSYSDTAHANEDHSTGMSRDTLLNKMLQYGESKGWSKDQMNRISNLKTQSQDYAKTHENSTSAEDTKTQAVNENKEFSLLANQYSDANIHAAYGNPRNGTGLRNFRSTMNVAGKEYLNNNPIAQEKMKDVEEQAKTSVTTDAVGDNEDARGAAQLFKAAALVANDGNATVDERAEAQKFLVQAVLSMQGLAPSNDIKPMKAPLTGKDIGTVKNSTGLSLDETEHAPVRASTFTKVDHEAKARENPLIAAAQTARVNQDKLDLTTGGDPNKRKAAASAKIGSAKTETEKSEARAALEQLTGIEAHPLTDKQHTTSVVGATIDRGEGANNKDSEEKGAAAKKLREENEAARRKDK